MAGNRRIDRWERVLPIRHRDNLVSSQFADSPKFHASYENEEVDMFALMSHDYAKQWRQEKEAVKRVIMETCDNDFLMRRYVIRGYLAKRKVMEKKPRFIMKRFQNVPAKINVVKAPASSFAQTNTEKSEETLTPPKTDHTSRTSSNLGELTKDSLEVTKKKKSIASKSSNIPSSSSGESVAEEIEEGEKKIHFKKEKEEVTDSHLPYENKSVYYITCHRCHKKLTDEEVKKEMTENDYLRPTSDIELNNECQDEDYKTQCEGTGFASSEVSTPFKDDQLRS